MRADLRRLIYVERARRPARSGRRASRTVSRAGACCALLCSAVHRRAGALGSERREGEMYDFQSCHRPAVWVPGWWAGGHRFDSRPDLLGPAPLAVAVPNEFSRTIATANLKRKATRNALSATTEECDALAKRFDLFNGLCGRRH